MKLIMMAARRNMVGLCWTIGSGLASLAGAFLAIRWYPQAAFAKNPTGHFAWYLVQFAFTFSIPIAVAQFLVLITTLRNEISRWFVQLLLWLPVTSIGVASMILPLWWWSANTLTGVPWIAFVPLMPGATALALLQRALLAGLLDDKCFWVAQTIIGVVLGAIVGLALALMIPAPIEMTWAFVTVVGMCWPQGLVLARLLRD